MPELARQSVEIGFQSLECQDNTFVDAEDPTLLHFMREYESLDSLDRPSDTLSCPRRYRVVSDVHFRAGSVRLGDMTGESPPLPGDIDLDGISASITDLAKFLRQFWGDAVFSEDSLVYARQLAASDVNRDGVPLHIADFEMLLRIVFANEDPYEPRNPPKEASVSRLDWGIQVESESPLSMVYVEFWVHNSDTATYQFRAYPAPSSVVFTRVGERLRAVFDYIDSPYAGEFSPLVINMTPRPESRLQLVDLQLSTPPGLSVPAGGGDPSL